MDPVYKASEDGYFLNVETEAIENFTIKANVLYHKLVFSLNRITTIMMVQLNLLLIIQTIQIP